MDLRALRAGRLERLRGEIAAMGCAAAILFDPVNIRYATGARNMQVFMARNPARYLLVCAAGPAVLFEFPGCMHLARGLETIDEIRPATTVSYVAAGPRRDEMARRWARDIGRVLRRRVGSRERIAVERTDRLAAAVLEGQGFFLADAQIAVERARAIKSEHEIACQLESLRAVDRAVADLEAALRPGITENQLWAELHRRVIAEDGDYVETRLLSSGPRTNPWFQESSPRAIEAGDLVALDTDVVGPRGYYADYSRTFVCGDRPPRDRDRDLYAYAQEQIAHNLDVLAPGLGFREWAERAWPIPDRFRANRYFVLAHGVGMTGEYPYVLHREDFDAAGYDGVIEPNMTLCVESYIGDEGGPVGVKLEQQVRVTERGWELMSRYPLDERLAR